MNKKAVTNEQAFWVIMVIIILYLLYKAFKGA